MMDFKKGLTAFLAAAMITTTIPAWAALAQEDDATRGEVVQMLLTAADDYRPGVQKSDVIKGYEDGQLHEEKPDFKKFYESYANLWLSTSSRETQQYYAEIDPHSAEPVRVDCVLQSTDKFYEVFDIEEYDGMYVPPKERVHIW